MSLIDSGKAVLRSLFRRSSAEERTLRPTEADPSLELTGQEGQEPTGGRVFEGPAEGLRVGAYQVGRLLGRGGMGRVYEAFDPSLQRWVALKLSAAPLSSQEARAQAKLKHPNICKICEAGEADCHSSIAMQLIQGETLEACGGGLGLEQKALLLKQVAEALHAAHRVGLIHRDLKPANIMVERDPHRGLVPYVMDFGLARDVNSQGPTLAGQLLGTPSYMAPEQAMGKGLDRRCDVYSLGVVLYWLICGRVPFKGESLVELLAKIFHEEPPSIASLSPGLPGDLGTIVMKCLEKAPAARYESARALAEDLGRYLEGEPVRARPVGPFGRLLRRARKHRAMAAVVGVSLVGMGTLAVWGLRTRLRARTQALSAQRFGQMAERLEGFWRQALLLPAHDLRAEEALVRQQMGLIGSEMRGLGREAQGPGHFALGRACLALGRFEEARKELEAAWGAGYRPPELSLALGEALGSLYEAGMAQARGIPSKEVRRAREEALRRELGDPALQRLREGRSSPLATPLLVEAREALLGGRAEGARRLALRALEQGPWLFEARVIEVDALLRQADQAHEANHLEEGWRRLDEAEAALDAAQSVARSHPVLALDRLRLDQARWFLSYRVGRAWEPWLARLVLDGERALALDADRPGPWLVQAQVQRGAAVFLDAASPQRREASRRAVDCAGAAVEAARRRGEGDFFQAQAYLWLGLCEATAASAAQAVGFPEARSGFDRALEALEKARSLDPTNDFLDTAQGDVFGDLGTFEEQRGGDPLPAWERSCAAYRRLLDRRPSLIRTWNNLGITCKEQARYAMEEGRDPGPYFQEAERAFRRTTELDPTYAFGWNNQAVLASYRARHLLSRGQDPTAASREGIACATRAVGFNPKDGHFFLGRMEHHLWLALDAAARGRDPGPEFEAADRDAAEGLRLRPQELYSYYCAAWLGLHRARWNRIRGGDPRPDLGRAEGALARGLALNPGSPDLLLLRAQCGLFRGGAGRLGAALGDAKAVYAKNPRNAEAALVQAAILLRSAEEGAGPEALEPASALLDGVLARLSGQAEALGLRGAVRGARWDRGGRVDSRLLDQAREDLEASLRANALQVSELPAYDPRLVPAALRGLPKAPAR